MADHLPLHALLFVPASRPERFAKALDAGANAVIIDLEDAVERSRKVEARQAMHDFLVANPQAGVLVRVNDATTDWFADDIAVCAALPGVAGIVLPKTESAAQVALVAGTGKPVLPIIESARGVLALAEISAAQGVTRLSFGALDMMLETGTTPDTAGAKIVLDHIRSQVLLHSAVCRLEPPIDSVYPNFSDDDGLRAIAQQVRDMGFGGMLCIHPRQVAVVQQVFAPSEQELDWARRVVAQADDSGSLAFQIDGKMVDAPVIARARRIVVAAAH